MEKAVVKAGVTCRRESEVSSLVVDHGKVTAVVLKGGETLRADAVVSGVNPKLLFLDLLSEIDVPVGIRQHFQRYKSESGTFRMNVALSGLPAFRTDIKDHYLESGIIIAPSLNYMDRAYSDARTEGWSRQPIIEMLIPSTVDDSLAPEGCHVASLFCQHFDPSLGDQWDLLKENAADTVINEVDAYAPGFKASIVGREIHSPLDLEKKFNLTGGDIFHGRMSLEQLYSARPKPGMSAYQTHISNLFMCGSGTQPGGGVSGLPGYNAAAEIRKKLS